jgi:hypothetical protein
MWSKATHKKIRGYNESEMPWVKLSFEAAQRRDPAWMVDQDFRCLATPAGGLVLMHVILKDHLYDERSTMQFGIDTNPSAGYFVVGSNTQNREVFLTEAHCFYTLHDLADFIRSHKHIPFYLEMNGPGGVTAQFLREEECPFAEVWLDEQSKIDICTKSASVPIYVPLKFEEDVYPILTKQIWGEDKKIVKFSDAHYFDAYVLSVGELGGLDIINEESISNQQLKEMESLLGRY